MEPTSDFKIKRKPVGSAGLPGLKAPETANASPPSLQSASTSGDPAHDKPSCELVMAEKEDPSPPYSGETKTENATGPGPPPLASFTNDHGSPPEAPEIAGNPEKRSMLKTALDETRYFAGGLTTRPHESTKHYTILRHSSSLIFYRGPSTSVAITIFSSSQPETPLPPDRTIWLQQRGYSGDTGMKLKRLVGATGTWLDVTPAAQASVQDLDSYDERSWTRDIDRFMQKTAGDKTRRRPRETHVIRLPLAADDGYFRLILCTGGTTAAQAGVSATKRRVLCSSPVFRTASTSTDPSVFHGASLKTLPLELGVMVGSIVGVGKFTNLIAPVASKIQEQVSNYQPGVAVTEAATTAYGASGLQERLDTAGRQFEEARDASYDVLETFDEGAEVELGVVGPDDGPQSPYPIRCEGKVSRGTGKWMESMGVPTANVDGVPDDIKARLRGVYMGWACIVPNADLDKDVSLDWHEAVIRVGPSPHAAPTVAAKNVVTAHIIHDFGSKTFFSAKVKIVIMGFIRPIKTVTSREEMEELVAGDSSSTLSSLSRSSWGPELALERIKTAGSARSISERYVDARLTVQKRADSIPLHWAGVRSSGAASRDRSFGNGGYWIARG